jgi:DNA primase
MTGFSMTGLILETRHRKTRQTRHTGMTGFFPPKRKKSQYKIAPLTRWFSGFLTIFTNSVTGFVTGLILETRHEPHDGFHDGFFRGFFMVDTAYIQQKLDLLALIGRDTKLTFVARTRGGEWAGACPFCGGSDRLKVQPERGLWWCRQCIGVNTKHWQDAIAYVRKRDGLSFSQAARLCVDLIDGGAVLSDSFTPASFKQTGQPGLDVSDALLKIVEQAEQTLMGQGGDRARYWLCKRGLTVETIQARRLGLMLRGGEISGLYVPHGITIPCFCDDGRVSYVRVRFALPNHRGERYALVAGSLVIPYWVQRDGLPDLFIIEGEFDAFLLAQEAGQFFDVLTLGSVTGRLPDEHLAYLLAYKHIFICTDKDAEGDAAADYLLSVIGRERAMRVVPDAGKDITDMFQAGRDVATWALWVSGLMGLV